MPRLFLDLRGVPEIYPGNFFIAGGFTSNSHTSNGHTSKTVRSCAHDIVVTG